MLLTAHASKRPRGQFRGPVRFLSGLPFLQAVNHLIFIRPEKYMVS